MHLIAEAKRVQLLQPFTVLAGFKAVYHSLLGASNLVSMTRFQLVILSASLFKNDMYCSSITWRSSDLGGSQTLISFQKKVPKTFVYFVPPQDQIKNPLFQVGSINLYNINNRIHSNNPQSS